MRDFSTRHIEEIMKKKGGTGGGGFQLASRMDYSDITLSFNSSTKPKHLE